MRAAPTTQAVRLAAEATVRAYERAPEAVLRALASPRPHVLRADADPMQAAQQAIEILQRTARYLERDAQNIIDENEASPPSPEIAQQLLNIARALEKQCKRASVRLINLR